MVLILIGHAAGQDTDQIRVAAVVSLKIRPYLQALESVQEQMRMAKRTRLDVIYLEEHAAGDQARLAEKLEGMHYTAMLAIGPEAMKFNWNAFPGKHPAKTFCMVLNPESLVPAGRVGCGVPLNIPVYEQLYTFTSYLPDLKRIGLIYNPEHNAGFARQADLSAQYLGVSLVHLAVDKRSDILPVLQSSWRDIDALWMIPDRTVISKSLILYIIKHGIANNVAVLGYNRFFTESGAAMALVRNYKAIGRQAAEMTIRVSDGGACPTVIPGYDVVLNKEVLDALKISAVERNTP